MTGSTKRRSLPDSIPATSSSYAANNPCGYSRPSRRILRNSTATHTPSLFPNSYIDNGDCNRVCEFCNALFWYEERCISLSLQGVVKYTQCCKGGRVILPSVRLPAPEIVNLFQQPDFMLNIRAYNSIFSMTSFGATIDYTVNNGQGPYVFKIEGQIHHWLGSMCPPSNERPRFLQMYIYDTENEASNRLATFSNDGDGRLNRNIIDLLIRYLESSNELVRLFRTARDICSNACIPNFSIRLYASADAQSYDNPMPGTIGAIIPDNDSTRTGFDIVVHHKDQGPKRISKLHPGSNPARPNNLSIYYQMVEHSCV